MFYEQFRFKSILYSKVSYISVIMVFDFTYKEIELAMLLFCQMEEEGLDFVNLRK